MNALPQITQVIPQAPELERQVLAICMGYGEKVSEVADWLPSRVFNVESHRVMWDAILDLYTKRDPITAITVVMRLRDRGQLETVGGVAFVSQVAHGITSSTALEYSARILVQKYMARDAIRIGNRLSIDGYDDTIDPFDLLAKAQSDIRSLCELASPPERSMADIMPEIIDAKGKDLGIPSYFDDLDRYIRFDPGTVTIIGARPAMGKTAFLMSLAKRQAWAGHHPYIASLEMKDRGLANRLICGECRIPVWKAKRKKLDEQDLANMAAWYTDHGDKLGRMLINESASINAMSLAARLDRAKRQNHIDIVYVDYLGLMTPNEKAKDKYHRVSAISGELRVLAKEMDLPFVVLCQLSRPLKGATVKPPTLSDLRDSGEIEQDAEVVLFLHREAYYNEKADASVEVIVAKNRDGMDGSVKLYFDAQGIRMLPIHEMPNEPQEQHVF